MKIWLKVGPEDSKTVKRLGCGWDNSMKSWYFMAHTLKDLHPVARWIDHDMPSNQRKLDNAAALAAQQIAQKAEKAKIKAEKDQLKKKKADDQQAAAG